jgi:hypothetical protein
MSEEREALVFCFFSPKFRTPAPLVFAGLEFGGDVPRTEGAGCDVDFFLGIILFYPM